MDNKEKAQRGKGAEAQSNTTEVTLNGHERIVLGNAMPSTGHLVDLELQRELKEALSLGSDELKAAGYDPDQLTLQQARQVTKAFTWTDATMAIIRRELRRHEKAGTLHEVLLDFYKIYVEGK